VCDLSTIPDPLDDPGPLTCTVGRHSLRTHRPAFNSPARLIVYPLSPDCYVTATSAWSALLAGHSCPGHVAQKRRLDACLTKGGSVNCPGRLRLLHRAHNGIYPEAASVSLQETEGSIGLSRQYMEVIAKSMQGVGVAGRPGWLQAKGTSLGRPIVRNRSGSGHCRPAFTDRRGHRTRERRRTPWV
jgi:hypothetical protein